MCWLTGSSSNLLNKISIMSYQSVSNSSNLLQMRIKRQKFKVIVRFSQPADALLQPGDELEEEVLRLHLEAWQGVRLVFVVEVHLLMLLGRV